MVGNLDRFYCWSGGGIFLLIYTWQNTLSRVHRWCSRHFGVRASRADWGCVIAGEAQLYWRLAPGIVAAAVAEYPLRLVWSQMARAMIVGRHLIGAVGAVAY